METLIYTKLIANKAQGRKEVLNGQNYLAVPLVMIVEGILNGSRGKGLYLMEDISPSVLDWNGMPLTANHPTLNGKPVSARNPQVLQQYWLGSVFNTNVAEKKMTAEGWFQEEATKQKDLRIWNALQKGEPIELSTGLYSVNTDNNAGVWNGQDYEFKVKELKPDHLAVLVDTLGACSIKDGCGVLVNEYSHSTVRRELERLLAERVQPMRMGTPPNDYPEYPYILDVFADYIVFRKGEKLMRLGYKANLKKQTVSLSEDDPVEVQKVVSYPTLNNKEGNPMKEKIIDFLVANCSCWADSDRELLNGMTEEKLNSLKSQIEKHQKLQGDFTALQNSKAETKEPKPAPTPAPAPTTNEIKILTENEWFAQAPPAVAQAVQNAMRIERKAKDELILKLVANAADDNAKAELIKTYDAMPINTLEILVKNQKAPAPVEPDAPMGVIERLMRANYGGSEPTTNRQHRSEPKEVTEHAMVSNGLTFEDPVLSKK